MGGLHSTHGRIILGILEAGKDVRRSGECANAVRESHHPRPPVVDLKHLADARHAQLFLVQLVDDDGVRRFQVLHTPLHQIPRPSQRRVRIDPDDLD